MQGISIGDVVLVNFPYEDDPSIAKIRPAVIVETSNNKYTAIALKITSTPPRDYCNHQIISWALAGLIKPSTVRTSKKIRVPLDAIIRKSGALSEDDLSAILELYNNIR